MLSFVAISFIFILFFMWMTWYAMAPIRNYPYSIKLDKEINKLLDGGVKFTNIREYEGFVDLGHLKNIWIYNYPDALGNCYDISKGKKCMPSRLTCKRLKAELTKVLDKVRLHYMGVREYG